MSPFSQDLLAKSGQVKRQKEGYHIAVLEDQIYPSAKLFAMKGYAKLGLLIGDFPEVSVLRRFSALSVQNLLYLQAELRILELDLRKFAEEDDTSPHPHRKVYSVDWFALKESCDDDTEEGNDGRQWETMLGIRSKLEEYRMFLL